MKQIVWVHPETTFELEVPDALFDVISFAMNMRLVKGHFYKTRKDLRGRHAQMFIIDEFQPLEDDILKKLMDKEL